MDAPQPQPRMTTTGSQTGSDALQNSAAHQLSPAQLSELAQKVAMLLRYELRIERERQG